jgi:pimeloyl-ACP methyl ester carboxylesterase
MEEGLGIMKRIIILHGWTKTLDKWQPFLDILKKNEISADLLTIPGLTEKLDKTWNLSDYTNWLKNIADKEENKIILMGHSNGGKIALAFTNLYPKKIEKLILIDSAGIYHNEISLQIKRTIFKTIAKVGKKLTSSNIMKNLLYKLARESDYKDLDEKTKQTMINLISVDLKPILPQIKTPTLIIWGKDDKITPLSDGITINSLIRNSNLEIIENARHSPQFTHISEVANIIINNLKTK